MKRPSSSRNRFEVFDFCKDEERIESFSEKIMSKFGNPKKSHNSPLSKYCFLEFFTKGFKTGPKKVSHEPIDVDDSSPDHQSTKSVSNVLGTSPECGAHLGDHESGNHFSEANTFTARGLNLGVSSAGSKCLDFTLIQSLSNDEPIGVISDDESITSSCSFDLRVNQVSPEEPAHEGNEMLKFSVFDPHWCEGQEAIKSLDLGYNAIWNAKFNFDELVGDIIYPEGDPDAVSISKRDVELLQPERFVNDTVIDFYIKYLKNKIRPEEKHRFHFFNSFFFRKLADLDKDPSSVCEGKAAFQRVRKWTRKVNLFEKDYIFIPVNFSLHWSLIVICHPCEVANFKDEEIDKSPRVPCILHMDSKKGSHRGLKNLIQSYLLEEWRDRQSETPEDVSSRFLNLRFVPLELPQQENSFDCGLFLLHYVELFLKETPVNFNPFQITKCSNFLNRCWFPPAEASLKRAYIQKLIFQFVGNNSQKISPADYNDKCPSSQLGDSDERETVIEHFDDFSSSSKTCNGIPSIVQDGQGIEISVVPASPPTGVKCIGEPGLSSREFIEQGVTARFPHELHRKRIMSPIEEVEEVEEQVSNTPPSKAGCHTVDVIVAEPSETSHFTKSSKVLQASSNTRIYMHLEEHEDGDSSSGSSICGSQNSMGVDQYYSRKETVRETDEQESASISCEDFAGCVVEDSQEADEMHDGNASEGFLASCPINVIDLCHEDDDSCVNIDLKPKNIPLSGKDLVTKANAQLAAKKGNAYSFQRKGDNSRGACLVT